MTSLRKVRVVCGIRRASVILLFAFGGGTAAAAPNKLPTVTLTAPSSGATFAAPATITLSASASDPDGSIAKVDFYQGTTLIGTRAASPYTMTWSGVAGGAYSLTARATDNRGGAKTSTVVSITVTGPKVVITTPASGATIYAGTAVVSGSFFGDSDTTVLVDNGNTTRVATLDKNTYNATIPLYLGANTLRVVASRRDRTSDQAMVSVTGNGNPLLVFTAPATTVFDAPANITFSIDAMSPASSISRVEFYRNGALLGTATSPPYQQVWNSVPAGEHTVSAIATDALGVTGSTSLAIAVNGPNTPPAVSLTAPASGTAYLAPANIAIAANATDYDGSVALVEFLQNGVVVATTNVAPYAVTWNNVAAGSYSLTARATDNRSGVATSAPVNVIVSPPNSPPAVALANPVNGTAYVAPATIALEATASDSDGTIAKVDFFAGTTLIATATAVPYAFDWNSVAVGTYSLTAKATDNRGASTTSSAVAVTVNSNQPPAVSLVTPASGATYQAPASISLTAAAADPDGSVVKVDFYAGPALVGTATDVPYAITWTGAAAGTYALTVKATDNGGATATSASVIVSVSAPAIEILSPADGAAINGETVSVRGTIQAPGNSGVTVNGIVAAVDVTGNFYANNVPLVVGANTISATLTTLAEMTATQSITVTSTGPAAVRFSATPTQGIAPLEVTFQVWPGADTTITTVEVDTDGDGSFDQTLFADPWTVSVVYSGSGTITAMARVTDAQGTAHAETIPIVLIDPAMLDANLRAVWSGMKSALAVGDKPVAMRYLDASAQQKYGPVFDALLPNMPQIVDSFSELQSVSLADGLGEYAVNRTINGENRLFLIYFSRNGDGVWRLGSM